MSICYPLVIPTWYPLLSFTWNSIPGEARCCVFLRNWVTYRDHLSLDIFGGWRLSTSPSALASSKLAMPAELCSALSINPKCSTNAFLRLCCFDEARFCFESLRPVGERGLADTCLKKLDDIQEKAETVQMR